MTLGFFHHFLHHQCFIRPYKKVRTMIPVETIDALFLDSNLGIHAGISASCPSKLT